MAYKWGLLTTYKSWDDPPRSTGLLWDYFCCGHIKALKTEGSLRPMALSPRLSGWVRDRFTNVSKVGLSHLFRGRIQPAYIGVIFHLLSTMGIPVIIIFFNWCA